MFATKTLIPHGSNTLHGTGSGIVTENQTRNDGFLYYAMYCTHYTTLKEHPSFLTKTEDIKDSDMYPKFLTSVS